MNGRSRRHSDEPSFVKLMAVVVMSAIILAMILVTMVVVIIMPVGMLLLMFYEHCVDYAVYKSVDRHLNKDNPMDIIWFFVTQAFVYLTNYVVDMKASVIWHSMYNCIHVLLIMSINIYIILMLKISFIFIVNVFNSWYVWCKNQNNLYYDWKFRFTIEMISKIFAFNYS